MKGAGVSIVGLPHHARLLVNSGKFTKIGTYPAVKPVTGDVAFWPTVPVTHCAVVGIVGNEVRVINAPTFGQKTREQKIWGNPIIYRLKQTVARDDLGGASGGK